MAPKYSIMIPSYNGIQYLPSCVSSVISQDYDDYELIISDDHSTDGTEDYLSSLNHSNIIVLHTPHKMSMSEHWEWILTHARGEWCIFLGQDDGLQYYFFELADILIDIAGKRNIKTIASERAYYFWPGCESVYGNGHIQYEAIPLVSIFNTKLKALQALCGYKSYFDLPQMYTTSLFNKSLIEKVVNIQGGSFLITHPQDANLAAISCSMEHQYLYSHIPLGWVGTSPKSAGLAVSSDTNNRLKADYINKINDSKLNYCDKIGNFTIASCTLYFWGALIMSKSLQSWLWRHVINSRFMTYTVIAAGKRELKKGWGNIKDKYINVECTNKINNTLLNVFSFFIKLCHFCFRHIDRIKNKIINVFYTRIKIRYSQDEKKKMELINMEIRDVFYKRIKESL